MRYHPLKGEVCTVSLLQGVPKFVQSGRRRRGRKGVGLRYEAKVHAHLLAEFDGYIQSPWFRYTTSDAPNRINYAQPDGLIVDVEKGRILICEMKYSHCAEAYFQLLDKYLPIVRKFFNNSDSESDGGKPLWTFATVEIVYWFDCAVAFPTTPERRARLQDVREHELAVHVCRP